MKVFCFGDSITYGSSYSWVNHLRKNIEEEEGVRKASVYNLGVKGDSSRELLDRFEDEFDVRDSEREPIIIFQIGINDSQIIKTKNGNRIQIEEFKQNLEELWFKTKQKTDKIYFLGLTPVLDSKVDPLDWNNNKAYKTKQVRRYEDKLFEFCQEKDIEFIELYDEFMENGYGDFLRDGVHPNKEGHKIISKKVKNKLREENIV